MPDLQAFARLDAWREFDSHRGMGNKLALFVQQNAEVAGSGGVHRISPGRFRGLEDHRGRSAVIVSDLSPNDDSDSAIVALDDIAEFGRRAVFVVHILFGLSDCLA